MDFFAYFAVGIACALLQPKQPQSVIATILLCFAFTVLV